MGLWNLFGITEILNGPSPNFNNFPPEFGSQYKRQPTSTTGTSLIFQSVFFCGQQETQHHLLLVCPQPKFCCMPSVGRPCHTSFFSGTSLNCRSMRRQSSTPPSSRSSYIGIFGRSGTHGSLKPILLPPAKAVLANIVDDLCVSDTLRLWLHHFHKN